MYKPPKIVTQKNPPLNRPSEYKPPGGLYFEFAPLYKVKQSKNGNFLPTTQISLLTQAPPNISPSKHKPLKRAFEKYKPGAYFRNFTVVA